MECKWLRSWPKREETPVVLDHPYTPEQKAWARRRWARGQPVWVILQCGREWLLFDAIVAAEHLGTADREYLSTLAYRHWKEGLDTGELETILRGEE
jgi:hypothetical protein